MLKCEKCKKELEKRNLYDLVETDFKYHKYCKDCIRKAVKELSYNFSNDKKVFISFDYQKHDKKLKNILEIINLNIQNIIFEKLNTEPKFVEYFRKEMEKAIPSFLEQENYDRNKKY